MDNKERDLELNKYKDLVIATIDYCLKYEEFKIKTVDFDSEEYYRSLKIKTDEYYIKGKLSLLKQWFRDLTEMYIENTDFKFCNYLKEATEHQVNILELYYKKVDGIIEKGIITTNRQFYDISIMANYISQVKPVDINKLNLLNKLLSSFEQKKKINTAK